MKINYVKKETYLSDFLLCVRVRISLKFFFACISLIYYQLDIIKHCQILKTVKSYILTH